MTLDQEILTATIDNARGDLPIAVRIFTPFGKEMYHEGDKGQSKDIKWQTRSTIYGYKVYVAVSESYLVKKGLANLTTFLSIAFLIFLILYLLLGQIFKNYRRQVLDLVDTMNLISQGDSERRIDTSTKDQELLVIGNMINTMLDNMDKNIRGYLSAAAQPKRCQYAGATSPDQSPLHVQYTGIYPDVCRDARARRVG